MVGRQREPELWQTFFRLAPELVINEFRVPAVNMGLVPVADKSEPGEASSRLQRIGRYDITPCVVVSKSLVWNRSDEIFLAPLQH